MEQRAKKKPGTWNIELGTWNKTGSWQGRHRAWSMGHGEESVKRKAESGEMNMEPGTWNEVGRIRAQGSGRRAQGEERKA